MRGIVIFLVILAVSIVFCGIIPFVILPGQGIAMGLPVVSVVVALGIQIVGTLLVGFLVIVPAIAAKNLSPHMRRYSWLSAVFGAVAGFAGVLLWSIFGLGMTFPGPMVVFVGIAIFAATTIINWRLKLTS